MLDLTPFAGELIASGQFVNAGGVTCLNIAAWNGATWRALGAGLPGAPVTTIAAVGPTLVAAASFGTLNVAGCGTPCAHIVRWNGVSWEPMGTGLTPLQSFAGGGVQKVVALDGMAVALGAFQQGGGFWANAVRFNGAAWSPLGSLTLPSGFDIISQAAVVRGILYTNADTDVFVAQPILRWDGNAWSVLPAAPPGIMSALASFRGELAALGLFPPGGTGGTTNWAIYGCGCYADCNNSGTVTAADFGCFQSQFVAGHAYADCNGDHVHTVADFGCFQTQFVAGCP